MRLLSRKTIRRTIILLDSMATTIALVLALALRMWSRIEPWKVQLYSTLYILNLLLYLFWNTYRRAKNHEYDIAEMDPFANVVRVFREKGLQYAALIVILAMTKTFIKVSRLALLYWLLLDILFTVTVRIAYRSVIRRNRREGRVWGTRYLLVAVKGQEGLARARLERGLSTAEQIVETYPWDPEAGDGQLQELMTAVRRLRKQSDDAGCGLQGERSDLCCALYLPEARPELRNAVMRSLRRENVTFKVFLFGYGHCLPTKMIRDTGSFAAAEYNSLTERCRVFGVNYVVSDVETAAFSVLDLVAEGKSLKGSYLCFSNVHTLMMAQKDLNYRKILNDAAYTFPDGSPIADYQHKHGHTRAERVAGPDFMDAMFRATMDGSVSHYFYGSTQETIDRLRENLQKRYPGIRIAGMVSPPFRKETPEEDAETVRLINESGASFVWIGLGAPKQECWMAEHAGRLNGVMLGVGAGFNFYAGTTRRAPVWVQKIGFEWLYRLLQDPKRLASRYVVTNLQYMHCLFRELFQKDGD